MKLIVGLGNPDKKYENTRHNCGFIVVDKYVEEKQLSFKSKFNGLYSESIINGEKTILLKPQTYMNLSGICVQKFVNFYNINYDDIYIIYDDINFKVGEFKIRRNGSDGGHNGIKSILHNLNTQEIHRIKIGIGKNNIPLEDYVLQKFSNEDLKIINEVAIKICNIIDEIQKNNIDKLMEKYNGQNEK